MFHWLGRVVVARPWTVIAAWVLAAVAAVVFLPAMSSVVSADQTTFLPKDDEAARAETLAREAFPDRPKSSAIAIFQRRDGAPLSEADAASVTRAVEQLRAAAIPGVSQIASNQNSIAPNRTVQIAVISFDAQVYETRTEEAVEQLRERAGELVAGAPVEVGITGQAAILVDNKAAVERAGSIVGIATIALILILQLIIFRSPLAALLPIVTVMLVQTIAGRVIGGVGSALDESLSDFTPTLVVVVLFGVGTDYILFLLFRYRERLRLGDDSATAMREAVARVGDAIMSAGGAVVVAFSTLALAALGVFRTMGPALGIATFIMVLAGLTLVPAVVTLLGPRVFWPSKSWRQMPSGKVSGRLAAYVARRPAVTAGAVAVLFAALAAGSAGLALDYNPINQLPQQTESVQRFQTLQRGFPAGALNPVVVYVRDLDGGRLAEDEVRTVSERLASVPNVNSVRPPILNGAGTAARLDVVLESDPFAGKALDTVAGPLRDAAHAAAPSGTEVLVGGQSATYAGIRAANNRDLTVVLPIAALLIAGILAFLLRSVVAPLYLLPAVFLGFAATLGATVLAFQTLQDRPGLQFSLPVVLYVFVVAIGTDYNILTVARMREEARAGHPAREAARLAVSRTGPTVAAAGLVLAGSFAALLLGQVGFLTQMGFAVSLGIALSAFLMAALMVPALTVLFGRAAWWPSLRSPASPAPAAAEPEPAPVPTGSGS